ncbi:tRNA glutamyl-Q(34) synthetase GluQRS [Labrys miyagiensis]|uniref:tRNA glutamyl-Q(34) synthetase GluQRS n=1 Tax=Labrys miyagiensis TaxID=346912 RepID=UPI0024E15B03|nr:tRNA glutamyl-Q(34) synthetase GluQRS [Labrys miyagiensis]
MTNQTLPPVLRFAPSPNGYLHLGHAYSALLNKRFARELGGRLLLRIEDIDITRCRPDYETALREDLAWLGLEWEEPVRRQSEHFDDYAKALDRLQALGLLYRSYASRKDIAAASGQDWPRDPDGAPLYPREALQAIDNPAVHAEDEPFSLRLDMGKALALSPPLSWQELQPDLTCIEVLPAEPARWGDVILGRKEFPASYHLAVVHDDALQGVSHVARGRDTFQATAIHRLLQQLLGLPQPLYHHHALILGEEGAKLSKSLASKSLRALRAEGMTPADVRKLVGM